METIDRELLAPLRRWSGEYSARIVVDAFYFSSADWPKGKQFVIGHVLLTSWFVALACDYWALFAWRVGLWTGR